MVNLKSRRRGVAVKLSINDILTSEYKKAEEYNYLDLNGKEISRVNVVGIVLQKSETEAYKGFIIDDGTNSISGRIFDNRYVLDGLRVGDFVLVIGKPREYLSEKYLHAEIIKKIHPKWARVRKMELGKSFWGVTKEGGESGNIKENSKLKILNAIKKLDRGEGIPIEELPSDDPEETEKLVSLLLREGDIFEIRPGRLKVM